MNSATLQRLLAKTSFKTAELSVRRLRLLLLAAAMLLPAWGGMVAWFAPELSSTLSSRFTLSGVALTLASLSFVSQTVRRYLEVLAFGLATAIIAVQGYEVQVTNLNLYLAVGYIVASFGLAIAFESVLLLIATLVISASVSCLVGGSHPALPFPLFVSANLCTLIMAAVAFYDKLVLLNRLSRRYEDLDESRAILNEVQKVAKVGGWSMLVESQALWWSEQAFAIQDMPQVPSLSLEAMLGMIAPAARYLVKSSLRRACQDGTPFELDVPFEHTPSKVIWVRLTGKAEGPAGRIFRLVGSMQDITAEKRLSEELLEREAYARAVIDAIPGYVSWTDRHLNYVGVNRALAEIHGMEPEGFVGRPMGFTRSQRPDEITGFMRDLFATGARTAAREIKTYKATGEELWLLLSAKTYLDGKEAVLVGIDISAQKRSEQELREQKDLLAQILDHVPHGIYAKTIASDYRYVLWNHRMSSMTGHSHHEMIGATDLEVFPRAEADRLRRIDSEVISKKRLLDLAEEQLPTSTTPLVAHTMRVPVLDSAGEPKIVLGVVEDIREKKQREELIRTQQVQLLQASKMSALGEMSGGVAHEINNPLTVIMGFSARMSTLLAADHTDHTELKRCADKILSMSERIAKIVRGLKTFAREASSDPFEPVSLRSVIQDTSELCHQRFLNNGVELRLPDIAGDLAIDCRTVQISQVLVNLLNNAFDAVKMRDERWVQLEVADLGDCVSFRVTDSGPGIPTDIAEKMLQPFFTTKPIGQGTGLGLSISRGIIESHHGNLYYDAANPHTSFVFVLPKTQQAKEIALPIAG